MSRKIDKILTVFAVVLVMGMAGLIMGLFGRGVLYPICNAALYVVDTSDYDENIADTIFMKVYGIDGDTLRCLGDTVIIMQNSDIPELKFFDLDSIYTGIDTAMIYNTPELPRPFEFRRFTLPPYKFEMPEVLKTVHV